MTEILKSPPPPLGLTLCLEAIERDRSSPFRTDPNSWKRDVGEVLRHRLETRRETLERLGPNGSAHRMLAILGQLRLGAGERLERTEETVGQLTGLSFRDFEALSREVDWLFEEGNSVLFRYPAYVRAVAELWPTADPDGGREIHAVLATQCLSILKEWLDRAKSCPSVALEPLPQYALRHLAAHLFRARGMGEKWGDLLLDWNYLRQFHRHFGAFALLEQFPDHGGAAGSSGMTESQVDSVMTLRKLLQAEHARLDAARGDLLPKD
jgi:hypothetical protein